MRIVRMFFTKIDPHKARPRFLILAALVGFMLIAQPQPAQAQWIVADPGEYAKEAVQWAKEALQWIQQQAEWVLDHFLWASAASGNNAGQLAQTRGQLIGAQANVDAIGQLPNKQFTTQYTVDRTLLTGANLCYQTMANSALQQVEQAKKAMLQSFFNSFMQVGAGGNDATAKVAMVKGMCDSGFLDPSDTTIPNGANLLKTINCSAPGHSGQFVGKQLDINSVVGTDELYMPANTTESTAKGKLLTLPTAAAATDTEMPAIAALWFCKIVHPATATTVSRSSGASLTDVAEYYDQITEKSGANVPSQSCLEQVVDRMAVGSGATGELQKVYVAQATLCLDMNKLGMLNATENANCQSNGMSWINAQTHWKCAQGRTDHVIFRAKQGATGETLLDEGKKGGNECTEYRDKIAASAQAFVQSMQAAQRNAATTITNQEAR